MPLNRNAPRNSLPETYDAMRVVNGTNYEGVDLNDYADLYDGPGEKRQTYPTPMGPLFGILGALGHYLVLAFYAPSLLSGNFEYLVEAGSYYSISYVMMVVGAIEVSGGRRRGETGAHYVARMIAKPYATMVRFALAGARKSPDAAREAVRWFTTPKGEEVSGE